MTDEGLDNFGKDLKRLGSLQEINIQKTKPRPWLNPSDPPIIFNPSYLLGKTVILSDDESESD